MFPTYRGLNKHLKQIHSIGRFQCKECGMGFAENYQLVRHCFRAHSEERPFACDSCGKSFKSAYELKEHSFTHSRERPYECDLCPKTFRQSAHFSAHKRMHEGRIKDRKTHYCDQCDFVTLYSTCLLYTSPSPRD